LKVAAYADLGGLGAKQGPPVSFVWTMPILLPLLLPWLAVLVLLALPSNRNPRAWWIWAPLISVALLGAGLVTANEALIDGGLNFSIQAACAAAFGLAAIWLLGSALARRCRALAIAFMALSFAATSLLAFVVSPVFEQVWGLRQWESALPFYLLLFWVVGGLVFAGALNLTGRTCRRFRRFRISLWLFLWLWIMWLLAGGLLACGEALTSGGHFEWSGILVATFVLSLVSFMVILPFLILSFTNSFYCERLNGLLRLPAPSAAPTVATSPPLADPQVTSA
jgi:hypothetical protein